MSQSLTEDQQIPEVSFGLPNRLETLPDEPSAAVLQDESGAKSLAHLHTHLETVLFRLVSAATPEEFGARRQELFTKFVDLSRAVYGTVRASDTQRAMHEVVEEVFRHLRQVLADDRRLLNDEQRGEADFCLDVLHRTHALVGQVLEELPMAALKETDWAQAFHHVQCCLGRLYWSTMHLRCLLLPIREENCPLPTVAVLQEILQGFRMGVHAYASARQAYDLCSPPQQEDDWGQITWDSEDELLVQQSTEARLGPPH